MPEWRDEPTKPRRPKPRGGFLQRLGSDLGFGAMAASTETRAGVDALQQYDEEEGSGRGLLSFIPGWVLIAALVLIVLFVVFFTSWA